MHARQEKITFAQMRAAGVRDRLIYCGDYRSSHPIAISGDAWPDDVVRYERRLVCSAGPAESTVPTCGPIQFENKISGNNEQSMTPAEFLTTCCAER